MSDEEKAKCRGCGRELNGRPYCYGRPAYHPQTGEQAKINHYGGFVCSYECDRRASLELERSMPGHDWRQTRLGCFSQASLDSNWRNQ